MTVRFIILFNSQQNSTDAIVGLQRKRAKWDSGMKCALTQTQRELGLGSKSPNSMFMLIPHPRAEGSSGNSSAGNHGKYEL